MERITNLLGRAGLFDDTVIALVLFFLAFLVIVLRVYSPSRRRQMDAMAHLPLDDASDDAAKPGASR